MKIDQGGSIEVWDAGLYEAKVLSCEAAESTWPGKEGQPRFKWVLRVKSTDGAEFNDIWHFTGTTLSTHKNALLRPFLKAVDPSCDLDSPGASERLDTDDFVGKYCRVILGINEEKGRNSVDKVLPIEGKAPTKPPAAKAAEPAAIPF